MLLRWFVVCGLWSSVLTGFGDCLFVRSGLDPERDRFRIRWYAEFVKIS
jgi:hypothetical protein